MCFRIEKDKEWLQRKKKVIVCRKSMLRLEKKDYSEFNRT